MTAERTDEQINERLRQWRQGDYALNVGGFLYGDIAEDEDAFDAREATEGVAGLVLISQTCDVVRLSDDKRFVSLSPLVTTDPRHWNEIAGGRYPSLTTLEHSPGDGMCVDLGRIMSVKKQLLASWDPRQGFTTPARAIRFAAAIERKLGRFAFPDAFVEAMKDFQDRVRSRHSRVGSSVGEVYRSIDQFRFVASPHWEADQIEITMFAILRPPGHREASDEAIGRELSERCRAVRWPANYGWSDPPFYAATANDFRGGDILNSQLADFEFLSL